MPYSHLLMMWTGGATVWLYLVYFAVRREDIAINFPVAFVMALLWPLTIPVSEAMKWAKPHGR